MEKSTLWKSCYIFKCSVKSWLKEMLMLKGFPLKDCADSLSAHNWSESFGGYWPHLPISRYFSWACAAPSPYEKLEVFSPKSLLEPKECSLTLAALNSGGELNFQQLGIRERELVLPRTVLIYSLCLNATCMLTFGFWISSLSSNSGPDCQQHSHTWMCHIYQHWYIQSQIIP